MIVREQQNKKKTWFIYFNIMYLWEHSHRDEISTIFIELYAIRIRKFFFASHLFFSFTWWWPRCEFKKLKLILFTPKLLFMNSVSLKYMWINIRIGFSGKCLPHDSRIVKKSEEKLLVLIFYNGCFHINSYKEEWCYM